MACGQVLSPPGMDDRFNPFKQPLQPSFFSQPIARPPFPRQFTEAAPSQRQAQYHNSAPPTRPPKRRRGGKNKARRPRNDGPRSRLPERAETPMSVPPTAPHAPYNNNSFYMQRDGPMTPAFVNGEGLQDAGYPTVDGDAAQLGAQLDFFGTGMRSGLLADCRLESDPDSEEDDGDGEWAASPATSEGPDAAEDHDLKKLPPSLQAVLAEQKARLQQLEDENLDLRERLSLAQHEIEDLKAKDRAAADTPLTASAQYAEPVSGGTAPA